MKKCELPTAEQALLIIPTYERHGSLLMDDSCSDVYRMLVLCKSEQKEIYRY